MGMEREHHRYLERDILNCSDIEELLDDYIDAELGEPLNHRFSIHIDSCEACRLLVSDCREIVQAAKLLAAQPIPQGVSERLRAVLREQVGHSVPLRNKPQLTLIK